MCKASGWNATWPCLSTGTQRKMGLAVALAAGTPLVLLDEPFNALDSASHSYLDAVLNAACKDIEAHNGRCWLIASHEPLRADRLTTIDLS
jgi:ABC-type sulfate/molybdate transport systems ATPase subunit